jgi:hypothetical protein
MTERLEKNMDRQDSTENIKSVEQARDLAADIINTVLQNVRGKSELQIKNELLLESGKYPELSPSGWYDPPPGGISVLFADSPYDRMKFETLRDEKYWPSNDSRFNDESVGLIYMSPVDKNTGMFGDMGFSFYNGKDEAVREHFKKAYKSVLAIANHAEVGMRMNELYSFAQAQFDRSGVKVGYMTTTHDPLKVNLGHTAPGSYGDRSPKRDTFRDTREAIRSRRLYINEAETFIIPETCAFTTEARLIDTDENMPNIFFHVIVTFVQGKKKVITNFDKIFKTLGMEYMYE